VVAGSLTTRLQGRITELLPQTVNAAMHRKLSEPGSAES
jgi:hypothetical protein